MTRARVVSASTAVIVILLVASGCWLLRSHDDGKPNARSTPAPTEAATASAAPTTSADREAADRAAVEHAWANFWVVGLSLQAYPPSQWPTRVAAVAVDPIKAQLLAQAAKDLRNGAEGFGAVVTRPSWPQPIAGKTSAVMQDCLDGNRAGTVVRKTGNKLTIGSARSNVRAFFVKGGDGKWRVRQVEIHVDEKC